jgi:ATP-dependent Clp protease ATP-binding subunit ClpA
VFERFSDRARRAVVLAQEEARLLDHNYLGTEHLLLGLIHEREGVAATSLEALGVSLEAARREVEDLIGRGAGSPPGDVPVTPRTTKVFESAFQEGLDLGHNYIGTEHLLLGLLGETEGVAAQVLETLGVGLDRARAAVLANLLRELQAAQPVTEAAEPWSHEAMHHEAPGIADQEGFSAEGRHLLVHAHIAAHRLGHEGLAPEHLLLAMYDIATGPVHEAMGDFGVSLGDVRERIVTATTPGETTADAERILARAKELAKERGRSVTGPGHVLLALAEDPEGLPSRVLVELVGNPSAVSVIAGNAADAEGTADGEEPEPPTGEDVWSRSRL